MTTRPRLKSRAELIDTLSVCSATNYSKELNDDNYH